jgi:hypothetical protein
VTALSPEAKSSASPVLRALVTAQILFALLAIGVSGYVLWSVKPLVEQRKLLEDSLGVLRTRLGETEAKLKETEARLQQATNLGRYVHPIDEIDRKALYTQHPQEARILQIILSLRERQTHWKLGGKTPQEGFDSPGFAFFVLRQLESQGVPLTRPTQDGAGEPTVPSAQVLRALFPVDATGRAVGDLVFYPEGYALFYFEDHNQQPYVIGMTPSGITALDPKFAAPAEYHRVLR